MSCCRGLHICATFCHCMPGALELYSCRAFASPLKFEARYSALERPQECLHGPQAPNDASLAFKEAWGRWEQDFACKVIA